MWQHLPLVQNNPVIHLPATWSFGGHIGGPPLATLLDGALREQAVHRATGDQINELPFFAPAVPGSLPVGADTGAGFVTELARRQLPGAPWWQALFSPSWTMPARRWSISAGCRACHLSAGLGAALAQAGTLMQQVLRNPGLAHHLGWPPAPSWHWDDGDPARPSWLLIGAGRVAMAGEACMGLVRPGLAPAQSCGHRLCRAGDQPLSGRHQHGLLLFFQEELKGCWCGERISGTEQLERRRLSAFATVAAGRDAGGGAVRPLAVLELDDASARSLGSLKHLRLPASAARSSSPPAW